MNPQSGRFITSDNYEGEDENPPSLHKYLYVSADPMNHTDPTGQGIFDHIIGLAPAGGVAAAIGTRAEVEAFNACEQSCITIEEWLEGIKWSPELNQVWLQTIIKGKQWVFLVSKLTAENTFNGGKFNEGFTYFGVELGVCLTQAISLMEPTLFRHYDL